MDSPSGNERHWWDSLPPEVKKKVRDFVNQPEVDLDPETIEAHIAEAGDFLGPIREKLAGLNERLEVVLSELERATLSYYELDGAVREFMADENHKLADLERCLWYPLGDPRGDVERLSRKARILGGLLEEMDLALDPDPRTAEEMNCQLVVARKMNDGVRTGVLKEAIRLRQSLGGNRVLPRPGWVT